MRRRGGRRRRGRQEHSIFEIEKAIPGILEEYTRGYSNDVLGSVLRCQVGDLSTRAPGPRPDRSGAPVARPGCFPASRSSASRCCSQLSPRSVPSSLRRRTTRCAPTRRGWYVRAEEPPRPAEGAACWSNLADPLRPRPCAGRLLKHQVRVRPSEVRCRRGRQVPGHRRLRGLQARARRPGPGQEGGRARRGAPEGWR